MMLALARSASDGLLSSIRMAFPEVASVASFDGHLSDARPAAAILPETMAWSRRFADEAADRIQALVPGVLTALVPGLDLEPALRLGLTQRFGMAELPALIRLLASNRHTDALLVDVPLAREQLCRLTQQLGVSPVTHLHTTLSPELPAKYHKAWRRGNSEAELATRAIASRMPSAGAAVLVGAYHEAAALHELVGSLRRHVPVGIVTKNMRPQTLAIAASLSDNMLSSDDLGSLRPDLASLHGCLETTERIVALDLRGEDPAVSSWIAELLKLASLGLRWQRFLHDTDVRVVAGSLDRSLVGALTVGMRQEPRTIDLQHGDVTAFSTGDLLRFDALVARTTNDAGAYLRDGLTARTVIVAGNPVWERTVTRVDPASRAVPRRLGRFVVGFFPQPLKGPWLSAASLQACYNALERTVVAIPDVHVVIKTRTDANRDAWACALAARYSQVTLLDESTATAKDVLSGCDAAVSVYSSALTDALYMGVPAIALDAFEVAPLEAPRALGVSVVSSGEALVESLLRLRQEGRPPSRAQPLAPGTFRRRLDEAVDYVLDASNHEPDQRAWRVRWLFSGRPKTRG